MTGTDPRIDAYIARSAEFARPILVYLRELVHASCPAVEESIKWGFPHFLYRGAILCSMAAFKRHAAFGFWKGALIDDVGGTGDDQVAMGQFGRLTTLADLPPKKVLAGYIRAAMKLNEDGAKVPGRERKTPKAELPVPAELAAALRSNAKARATFEKFTSSHRRDYSEWIAEAKREETRLRRAATAVEWLAEGKPRNWKHMDGGK
jgi:uncharacterized protein YdeI (YjbR/CyaY-like superfamily)